MKKLFFLAAVAGVATLSAANPYYNQSNNEDRYNEYNGVLNENNYQPQRKNRGYVTADQSQGSVQTYSNQRDAQVLPQGTNFVSDQTISNQINSLIKPGYMYKGFESVTFDVKNGEVTIRGLVETNSDKEKLERDIKAIKGVRNLNSQINLKSQRLLRNNSQSQDRWLAAQNYSNSQSASTLDKSPSTIEKSLPDNAQTESDRQLNVKIRSLLERGPLAKKVAFVILNTNNGIVTLTGRVDKMSDIDTIVIEVRKVSGVKNVNNQLSAKSK